MSEKIWVICWVFTEVLGITTVVSYGSVAYFKPRILLNRRTARLFAGIYFFFMFAHRISGPVTTQGPLVPKLDCLIS